MIDIFVSRPSWIGQDFIPGLNGFISQMQVLGLNPRTIGVTDYPNHAPLDEVITLMGKCSGAIILGYPQIEVATGFLKDKGIKSVLLPTEWNHIEAGLAYAQRLPLLVIHHFGVERGVFEHGALNCFIHKTDFSNPSWPLDGAILGAIKAWKDRIQNVSRKGETSINPHEKAGIPYCPNCSQGEKRIYMTPLSSFYASTYNATHECKRCGFIGKY